MTKDYKFTFINMKLEHMYGPKDNFSKFIPFLIENMLRNKEEIKLTRGEQERDFIYIDDVVSAYIVILKNISQFNKKFYDIEVGTGISIKIRDVSNLIKKLCNSTTKLKFGALPYRKNEVMKSYANPVFLKKIGWSPLINIKEGLERTISYYKKRMGGKNGK